MAKRSGAEIWMSFVDVLATMPEVRARLVDEHSPDELGFCRTCRVPGRGTPGVKFPCSIAALVADADSRAVVLAP